MFCRHLSFEVSNQSQMQEARKKAEAEKIHIMEELWQARFGYGGKGVPNFQRVSALVTIICAPIPILFGLTISQEGVKLPPEPPGHCSKELQVTNPFKLSKGHVTRHVASSCQER